MSLINSIIHINTACNSRCTTCDFWKSEKIYLPLTKFIRIVDQLKDSDIDQIMISGGEPLLHPDLIKMVDYVKSNNIRVMLNTNGLALDKWIHNQRINQLLDSVDMFVISLDSSNSNTYKKIRGIDGFNRLIKNIKELKVYIRNYPKDIIKPQVSLRCTIQKHNLLEIPDIVKLAKKLDCILGLNPIDAVSDSFGRNVDAIEKYNLLPSNNELLKFANLLETESIFKNRESLREQNSNWNKEKFYKLINYFKVLNGSESLQFKNRTACIIPYTNLIFDANGDVKLCFYEKISNIYKNEDFKYLFNPENVHKLIKEMEEKDKCVNCRCKIFC